MHAILYLSGIGGAITLATVVRPHSPCRACRKYLRRQRSKDVANHDDRV